MPSCREQLGLPEPTPAPDEDALIAILMRFTDTEHEAWDVIEHVLDGSATYFEREVYRIAEDALHIDDEPEVVAEPAAAKTRRAA